METTIGVPVLELIGSGRPIKVHLTIDKTAVIGLQHQGLEVNNGTFTKPCLLLDETMQELLVLIEVENQQRALKINKSVVHSILYLP